MQSQTPAVRAPQGAVAWHPITGWIYDPADIPTDRAGYRVETVAGGRVFDVTPASPAPLVAVLRLDAAITELAARIDDVRPDLLMDLAVRAPADSRTWTASTGWIADGDEQATAQARDDHGVGSAEITHVTRPARFHARGPAAVPAGDTRRTTVGCAALG